MLLKFSFFLFQGVRCRFHELHYAKFNEALVNDFMKHHFTKVVIGELREVGEDFVKWKNAKSPSVDFVKVKKMQIPRDEEVEPPHSPPTSSSAGASMRKWKR